MRRERSPSYWQTYNLVNPEVVPIIDGTLPLPRFTAVADKFITLLLWSEQHAFLGID